MSPISDLGSAAPPAAGMPAPTEPLRVPDEAMIGVARDFADLHGECLETPRSFLFFSFLTYLGALISRKATLGSAIAPEPRLYTVILGESADTRKSTALRMADDFFRSLGAEHEPCVLFGVGSAEGIAAELREHPALLLHFDELKAFVDKARADHSIALPMVSTLFDRDSYDNRTKAERLAVRGASLSLLAACTVDTYASMFDERFFAIGFLNRLWLVSDRATRRVPIPRPLPLAALDRLRDRVRSLLRVVDAAYTSNGLRAVVYVVTPRAERIFSDWYHARTGSTFEKRLDSYGHRLMLLLAVSAGQAEIDEPIARATVALLQYQLAVRRESDPVDAENLVARVEEKIRRALGRGSLPMRELQRRVHYNRVGLWAWRTAFDNLKTGGEIAANRDSGLVWLIEPVTTTVTTSQNGFSANADA